MRTWMAIVAVVVMLLSAGAVQAVVIETVPVGNPGNAADTTTGFGGVPYAYNIGTYEVTQGQYTEFLNAVAATDTYGLYNAKMQYPNDSWKNTAITQSGSSGSYSYSVASDCANRPVNWIVWGSAARFTNWLSNGQPTGAQSVSTTEDGSYALNGATTDAALLAVTRNVGSTWVLPTLNEWYKAAFYDPNKLGGAGYWLYHTRSDTHPGRDLTDASGNNANYYDPSPYPIEPGYYSTVVGQFEKSASPYGTFDQGGNALEWNETSDGTGRGQRGGSYISDAFMGNSLVSSFNAYYNPTALNLDGGFRVASVPEPASLTLLTLGGLALLRRRRNK